jgi:mutator protein MutT
MITPADLARMTANASGKHAQNSPTPGEAFHTSASKPVWCSGQEGTRPASGTDATDADRHGFPAESIATRAIITEVSHTAQTIHRLAGGEHARSSVRFLDAKSTPTPKVMPSHRSVESPARFATLEAQELPVEREYSAGGLVFDDQGRVALIARHSRNGHLEWCLPKGHIEKGETPEQTAVREVHEETGILGEVVDSIATIDYWFTGTSQRIHKLVHHFALRRIGGELTVEGDPDHEAEDAIWVSFNDLESVLSYPNERKIAWLWARKQNRRGEK